MKKNSAKKPTKSSGVSKTSRVAKKNHKPAMAIASLFFIFNGLLLYMSDLGEGRGGHTVNPNGKKVKPEKPQISDGRSLTRFVIKNNKIYYQKKQISLEKFDKIITKLKAQKKHPQLLFHETTIAKGFYDDIRKRLQKKNITFSESFNTPK